MGWGIVEMVLGDRNFMYGLADEQALENLETKGPALFDLSVLPPSPKVRRLKPKGARPVEARALPPDVDLRTTIVGFPRLHLDSRPPHVHAFIFLQCVALVCGRWWIHVHAQISTGTRQTTNFTRCVDVAVAPEGPVALVAAETAVFALALDEAGHPTGELQRFGKAEGLTGPTLPQWLWRPSGVGPLWRMRKARLTWWPWMPTAR